MSARWNVVLTAWLLAGVSACQQYTINAIPPKASEPVDTAVTAPPEEEPPPPEDTPAPPEDTPEEVVDESPPEEEPPPPGPINEPIALAGVDQTVAPLDTVHLDGTGSFDPGGYVPLTYDWTIVQRPAGSTALLLRSRTATPQFWADVAGDYVVELGVRNSGGVWDSTPDRVTIHAVPNQEFYVQLTWDAASDLDLHVKQPGYTIFDRPQDCNFCNKTPNWFGGGAADNPSLDWDSIQGYGPETTTIAHPAAGDFDVQVHYYGVGGATSCGGPCPASRATLDFYVNGVLTFTMQRMMRNQGEVWEAASVNWPSTTISVVNNLTTTNRTSCQ
jgi:hypothetical protein